MGAGSEPWRGAKTCGLSGRASLMPPFCSGMARLPHSLLHRNKREVRLNECRFGHENIGIAMVPSKAFGKDEEAIGLLCLLKLTTSVTTLHGARLGRSLRSCLLESPLCGPTDCQAAESQPGQTRGVPLFRGEREAGRAGPLCGLWLGLLGGACWSEIFLLVATEL